VEVEGVDGAEVVSSAFGDVEVAGVFDRGDDGGAQTGRVALVPEGRGRRGRGRGQQMRQDGGRGQAEAGRVTGLPSS
jgi:hypothetical protein